MYSKVLLFRPLDDKTSLQIRTTGKCYFAVIFQISSLICVIHIYYDGEKAVIMNKGPHSKSPYKNTYF